MSLLSSGTGYEDAGSCNSPPAVSGLLLRGSCPGNSCTSHQQPTDALAGSIAFEGKSFNVFLQATCTVDFISHPGPSACHWWRIHDHSGPVGSERDSRRTEGGT